jgi:hypothetical protein
MSLKIINDFINSSCKNMPSIERKLIKHTDISSLKIVSYVKSVLIDFAQPARTIIHLRLEI